MSQTLVPELICSDLAATRAFYVDVLHFRVLYERPEETFLCLTREGVDMMFEQADGPGRRWITGRLEKPFGRGINFQIATDDVAGLAAEISHACSWSIYVPLEEKQYRRGEQICMNRQFVVQDPDGYLLRFAEFLGD